MAAENVHTIPVDLAERGYTVRIGQGLLAEVGPTVAGLGATQAVIVADATVAAHYGPAVQASLSQAGLAARLIEFPAGEASKTFSTVSDVLDELFAGEPAIDRQTVLVALGGGVTGDLAGFVAAVALRGLRFVQVPTSLLAFVDSSVGGKTGVDHPTGKNLIGAFHQPRAVLIDVDTLATLPAEHVRNGLAECVKHGVIRDASLLDAIERDADALLAARPGEMAEFVARNVRIKADVVVADERESGQRAHLNFGHTIGHAIEAADHYAGRLHGECVALGMVAVNEIAVGRGMIPRADADRVRDLLARLGLPTTAAVEIDTIWPIMLRDKKNRGGKIRFVLPTTLGAVDVFDDVSRQEVIAALNALTP